MLGDIVAGTEVPLPRNLESGFGGVDATSAAFSGVLPGLFDLSRRGRMSGAGFREPVGLSYE